MKKHGVALCDTCRSPLGIIRTSTVSDSEGPWEVNKELLQEIVRDIRLGYRIYDLKKQAIVPTEGVVLGPGYAPCILCSKCRCMSSALAWESRLGIVYGPFCGPCLENRIQSVYTHNGEVEDVFIYTIQTDRRHISRWLTLMEAFGPPSTNTAPDQDVRVPF